MDPKIPLSDELGYLLLLFLLFIVPRLLQRFKLPSAITSVGLGAIAGCGFHLFTGDPTVNLLSTFGIVSLFLFAGLEVDLGEIRSAARVIIQHIVICVALLVGITYAAKWVFELETRPATLLALALTTPSTGFILSTIASTGMNLEEVFWLKSKAIATEMVALGVLFVTLQSTSFERLGISLLSLVALIAVLPILFRAFAAHIVPYAPRSEFAFLLMLGILCAYVTRQIGAYYLVGAFIVGVVAQRFRERMPALTSNEMLHAVEVFGSLFIPFYFFHAGLHFHPEDFLPKAVLTGVGLLAAMVPLRVASVAFHRRIVLGEPLRTSARIGTSMLPTLVFTLVIAEILRERFAISSTLFGALIVYTCVITLLPTLVLHVPPGEFDAPSDSVLASETNPDHSGKIDVPHRSDA